MAAIAVFADGNLNEYQPTVYILDAALAAVIDSFATRPTLASANALVSFIFGFLGQEIFGPKTLCKVRLQVRVVDFS